MADVIFTTETCLKSELFGRIKAIMTAAGWADISSNPATDFTVMRSPGEEGNRNLILQLREHAGTAAQSISTSNYTIMNYRLPAGYTPGATGVAGTFTRTGEAWRTLYIASTTSNVIDAGVLMKIRYHCNKNRLLLCI